MVHQTVVAIGKGGKGWGSLYMHAMMPIELSWQAEVAYARRAQP